MRAAGRDVWVKIRASEAKRAEWHAKACSAGLTLSDLVRRSVGRVRTWTVAHAEVERERATTTPRSGSCTAGFTRCSHSAWALGSARATIRATPPPRPSRPSPYRRDSHPTCPPATASRIHARTAVQQVTSRLESSPSITVRASRSAASTYIPYFCFTATMRAAYQPRLYWGRHSAASLSDF